VVKTMKINIQKLERERKRFGENKTRFSSRLGFSSSLYSKILKSKTTTFKSISKIAARLKMDPKDLLIS